MHRIITLVVIVGLLLSTNGGKSRIVAQQDVPPPQQDQLFEHLLAQHPVLTHRELAELTPPDKTLDRISFDPTEFEFFDDVVKTLQLTKVEQEMLASKGIVSVDHAAPYSFGWMYYAVYEQDLPVLITTDSILHALHRTYDDLLMELEETYFFVALKEILAQCHNELATESRSGEMVDSARDVDLYLTVARNLLAGAGATADVWGREWNGKIIVESKLGQDKQAVQVLERIQSLQLQDLIRGEFTAIYGGRRAIDYSQFQPRGHYIKSRALSRYFRAMMWLGRADTGWNILPPDPQSGIVSDSRRELRNAVLMTELLRKTGADRKFRQICEILNLMIGESDNLTVFQLIDFLQEHQIEEASQLASNRVEELQEALLQSDLGSQMIRSQVLLSDLHDLYQPAPPRLFQLFGQSFVIDSFVLSKVVFDSIIHNGKKVERWMPTGMDVAFALGNDATVPLVESEMDQYPYAANLRASRQFVAQQPPAFWHDNLYNIWLGAIRTLDRDLTNEPHVPQVFRTRTWQYKQLQTQLASWAELRHDTVLYAKQSMTAQNSCEYPSGYVEPYPEFFAQIKSFAEEAARRFRSAELTPIRQNRYDDRQPVGEFFDNMAVTVGKLESLARKELAAEPFTESEQEWLKQAMQVEECFSGGATFTGWYPKLFYSGKARCADWQPTIVDVHTDPNRKEVLEEGVGSAEFLVVAIEGHDVGRIYVGPAYSYYEFTQPAEDRLTDDTWAQMLRQKQAPPRPPWTKEFQPPAHARYLNMRFRK